MLEKLFNTKILEGNRLPWVDYAKGIAISLVVYRHILIGFTRAGLEVNEYFLKANEVVYSFRMPLFFILSGIFVQRALSKRSVQEFIKNKFQTMLYPYLIWSIIQVSLQIALSSYVNADRSAADYLSILIQPREIDQMWFLFALFNVSMFYLVIHKYLRLTYLLKLALAVALYYCSIYVQEYSLIHDVLYYFIFLVVGDGISKYATNKKNYELLSSNKMLFGLLPVFVISQWYWINNPEMNLYSFALIALLGSGFTFICSFTLMRLGIAKFIRIIGYHSLYIYVMHVMFSAALRIILVNFIGITNIPMLLVLGTSFGIVMPIICYNLSMKWGLGFLYRPPTSK